MSKHPLCLAAVVVVFPSVGFAQTATPAPTPHAPYVATPRAGTSWQITVRLTSPAKHGPAEKKSAARPARIPTCIVAHRGANLTEIEVTWSDGTKTNGYVQGDRFIQKAATGTISASAVEDQEYALPIFTRGYQGTAWVNLSGYKQVEAVGKKQAYKYAGHFETEVAGDTPVQEELDAWIGVEDGVPLRVVMGPLVYTFGPVVEENEPVELPPDLKAFLENVSKQEDAQESMRKASQAVPK